MKIKEIDRTANITWSPAAHHPIYLAAGTAAQQLDATFSTTASLEIYSLNLTEPGLDMSLKGSVASDFRFHKVIWGCEGMKTSVHSSGVLVTGGDGGNILIYDPAKLLAGESSLLHHATKHTGPVHSLDFNKFQPYLLASGASDSEIFIWDINNPTSPMTPGAKSQPAEEVTCVAWNWQVQHILASTFPARCVVWDMRKNEPIIKVSDATSRLRCKTVAWHPEVATQLCLSSEDDHCPLIQLWDLRFATSPLRTLEHHQRGVLSIAWCPHDPDLLLSCGKDNRILCWNPNSNVENGEVVCELPTSNQWSFDVAWCPRNPAVIASSSFDGHVSVYSLMGGQQQVQCSSKIAESFPDAEKITQAQIPQSSHRHISISLQKPPKWLRKPVGASFGFGGKLVHFVHETSVQPGQPLPRCVVISQVVTEPELLKKSAKLESALSSGNLLEFCHSKVDDCKDNHDKMSWSFLQATFDPSPRTKMLSLLGYDPQTVDSEVSSLIKKSCNTKILHDKDSLAGKLSEITTSDESVPSGDSTFDSIAAKQKEIDESPLLIKTDKDSTDGLLSQALLTGNIEAAVELCLQEDRWADALVLAQCGGSELLQKTQELYFKSCASDSARLISAVVTSNWMKVVKLCDISCWKESLAAILTYAKPDEFTFLCEILGSRMEVEDGGSLVQNALLCYICSGNLERLAQCWIKTREKSDISMSLPSLVEQVMILRQAVEQLTGHSPPLQTGTLSALLGQYAALLAAQGSLSSAITYLVDANEKTLAVLRDRICRSLGQPSNFPFPTVEVKGPPSVNQIPQTQPVASADIKQTYQPLTQPAQFPPYSAPLPSVPTSGYYNPSSTMVPQGHHQPSPLPPSASVPPQSLVLCHPSATVPPPVMPPPPPPSNPSGTIHQSTEPANQPSGKGTSTHLSHRYPKHLHDPSVYSENAFSTQYYQPTPFPQSSQPPGSLYDPSSSFAKQPGPTSYYSTEQQNPPLMYPNSSAISSHSSMIYSSYSTTAPAVSAPPPPPPAVPYSSTPLPSSYTEAKPGWNDPPLLKSSLSKPVASSFEPLAPITTPLIGSQVPDTAPGQHQFQQPGYFVPSFTTEPQQQGIPQNIPGPTPVPSSNPTQGMQVKPEPPKEKGPIPPEHQVLQDIFEDLRQQCQQVTTNPQMRRKLEDVAKKLENLYDRLRDNVLSSGVLLGLHQIIQAIQQSDYQAALSIHGQLVSTANFSEIGGFMPSVKVLLQTASQLGVYLQ